MSKGTAERTGFYDSMPLPELVMRLGMFASINHGLANKAIGALDWANTTHVPGAKWAAKKILGKSALPIFFGGADLEDVVENAYASMERGISPIIDYSAPETSEMNDTSTEASDARADGVEDAPVTDRYADVAAEYHRVVDACAGLNSWAQSRGLSSRAFMAVKIGTLAPTDVLRSLSAKIALGDDFTPEEATALEDLETRSFVIFRDAYKKGVGLYVDAEDTAINPVIMRVLEDALTHETADMSPAVTIQAYLKNCKETVKDVIAIGKRSKRPVDVKLVRGAYIGYAEERPYIFNFKSQTDNEYDFVLQELFHSKHIGEITVATHNAISSQIAMVLADDYPEQAHKLSLAKLKGLADSRISDISLPVREYWPYTGRGHELDGVAYLGRRGTEMMGKLSDSERSRAGEEIDAICAAIARRLAHSVAGKAADRVAHSFLGEALSKATQRVRTSAEELKMRVGR